MEPLKRRRGISDGIRWWWNTRAAGKLRIQAAGRRNRQQIEEQQNKLVFARRAAPFPETSPGSITAILTVYRRAEYLREQIEALRNQTVPPGEIWVWTNSSEEDLIDFSGLVDRVVVSNSNWKFWGRFALAHLVRTDHVALFDDDILPQPRWFENCLRTMDELKDAILGDSGVLLPAQGGYSSKNKVGWNGAHLDRPAQVDLVGHCWFMPRRNVRYMWREDPYSWENGEDIHLSYMALKHGGVKTWVPPHPESDQSLWSCRPDFGKVVGRTKPATFKTADHKSVRSGIVDACRRDGWKTVENRQ